MQDQVVEFLSEQSTTSVLTEYLDAWLPWYDVLRDHGLRVVPHGHGYDVSSRLLDPWYRRQYLRLNTTDAVVVVSHHSARRLVELGVDEDRIHVVPCGVDVPQALPTKGDRAEVRALAVGRMVAKKAPLTTLEAVRVAMERCEGLTLRYLGEGPLQAQAEDFVRRHGLGGRITLLGARNHQEVLDEMRRADLFVQHSVVDPETGDEEGLPVAVLEAMAQGLPVVTTRHGGLPEAVEDGVTGILVDEGDGASMADAVSDLARDPALRRRMGRAGWERARRSFMWTKERIRLLELLNLVEDTGEVV